MRKNLLLNILICCAISQLANADIVSDQMQLINQSPMQKDSSLWQRMRDGFALDHRETKEVLYWEKRYGSPKYFNIIMQNAAPYLYFVVGEMERRGIPLELALIPIVESTYNPNAISPAAVSTGMWQFLAGSGKRFGMTINSDLDERKDIVKSTRGAIAYLQYLHDLFGNWELAIAAYNWGEGNINNAVNSANSKNFYDLDVRDVTKQYVPKVIALANIIQNPQKFGIKLIDLPNKPYFAIAYPPSPVTLSDFINQANMTPAINKKLNPQYNSISYSVSTNQRLLVPISNQATYLASIGKPASAVFDQSPITSSAPVIDASDASQNIASSDTNASAPSANSDPIGSLIAQKNKSTSTNTDDNSSDINNTTTLEKSSDISSLLNGGENNDNSNSSGNANYTNYIVVQGDTLYSISKKFSISIDQIKADNQITDGGIKLDQKLVIRNSANNS